MYQFIRIRNLFPLLIIAVFALLISIYYQRIVEFPFRFELKNFLVGDKLAKGESLYTDIIVSLTPASGFIFQILSFAGINLKYNYLIGKVILLFQAILLNRQFNRLNLFPMAGNALTILYLILSANSPEFQLPSANLFGLTFLILCWVELTERLRKNTPSNRLYILGIFLGLACSFYLSFIYFLFWIIVSLFAHSNVLAREIALFFLGFITVSLGNYLLLNFNGSFEYYLDFYLINAINFKFPEQSFFNNEFLILLPFLIVGIIRNFLIKIRSISSIQNRIFQSNLILFFNSLFLIPFLHSYQLVDFTYFILPCSLLFIESLELLKGNFKKEILLMIFLALGIFNQYTNFSKQNLNNDRIHPKISLKNEKLMVLGPDIDEYYLNKEESPFIDWDLTEYYFNHLDEFSTVIRIKELLEKNHPEFIYDPQNQFIKIKNRLPQIFNQFKKVDENLYQKI